MTTTIQTRDHRANNFDFLRFVLALFVIYFHSYPLLLGDGHEDLIGRATHGQLSGADAVPFFFFISGFLVTASWESSRGFADYIRRRILRIYPAFVVASLFCAVVVGTLASANAAQYLARIHWLKFGGYVAVLAGPYLPPLFQQSPYPNAVDGSFWSIRYEFWCYLLVAVLGAAALFRRRIIILGVYVIAIGFNGICAIRNIHLPGNRDYKLIGNPHVWQYVLPFFLAGMVFYLYRDRIPRSRPVTAVVLILFCSQAFLNLYATVTLPVIGVYLLYRFAFSDKINFHGFAKRGDFSYGLYLYAFPVQQLLVQFYGRHLTPLSLFVSASITTIVLAVASWYGVERPFLRLKSRASHAAATLLQANALADTRS